jgi:uncharacterized protein
MTFLPESIRDAWENREGPAILATVDSDGVPNAIYVTCVSSFEDQLVVADNYFDKTRKNLLNSGKGSMLFQSSEGKAYQVKGTLEYHKEGEIFDHMKTWNPTKHPGHAAVTLKVEKVYSGAEKLFEA